MIARSCRRTAEPPLTESRAAEAVAIRAAKASGEEATIKVVQGPTTPHMYANLAPLQGTC